MRVHTGDDKLVITTESETVDFDLPKDVDNNLKQEIDSILQYNGLLAEHTVSTRLDNYWPNVSMKMIFMNTENSKTNEPHKFVLNLLQRLALKTSNKHIAL